MQPTVYVWDETLRDGEQSPGVSLTIQDKVAIARALDEAGVTVIDAGFPAVSEQEREAITAVVGLGLRARIGVTVRGRQEDIDMALDCGVREVYMFLPTSPLHMRVKFGWTEEEVLHHGLQLARYARRRGLDVVFIAEDTSRSDTGFVSRLFTAMHGVGVIGCIITDTVGCGTPTSIGRLAGTIRESTPPGLHLGIHCHNDFGLATANTLAAVEQGVDFITATVNGIGERAGNAALEEVAAALEFLYKVKTGIQTEKLYSLSQLVEGCSGMPVPPNKAVTGFNAFRHESGIHTQALLKAPESYEVLKPESVGQSRGWVFGKHSGNTLLEALAAERRITLQDETLQQFKGTMEAAMDPQAKRLAIKELHLYYARHLGLSPDQAFKLLLGNNV